MTGQPAGGELRHRTVHGNGASLAVRESGPDSGTPVLFVHGYPDDQSLWDALRRMLPGVHVISYDVRGAGESSAPGHRREYRIERLVDDLVTVVSATVPAARPFHLVGHDWGSVQSWDALVDPRLAGRIASFVSLSGPSLDHVAVGMPRRPRRERYGQLARSAYVGLFQLPRLPERLWRTEHRLTGLLLRALSAQGGPDRWTPRLARNAVNGLELYRANVRERLARPRPPRVDLPVLLVIATRDPFVTEPYHRATRRFCSRLTSVRIDAAHWHPRSQPELLAGLLENWISAGVGLDQEDSARGNETPGHG